MIERIIRAVAGTFILASVALAIWVDVTLPLLASTCCNRPSPGFVPWNIS